MERNLSKENIRSKVENQIFLRETFDYDKRGFLVWKSDRGRKTKKGEKAGYRLGSSKGDGIKLHNVAMTVGRIIWILHNGKIDPDFAIWTKNGNIQDTRIENLELRKKKKAVLMDRSLEKHPEILKELFSYNPDTGELTWRISRSNCIKAGHVIKQVHVNIDHVPYRVYRICFVIFHGRPIGAGRVIDHINGNTNDNRIQNLREVSQRENAINSRRITSKPDGMPKGVWKHKMCSRFEARIQVDGKKMYLGLFKTAEEAGKAYSEAAIKYFGEFACLDR